MSLRTEILNLEVVLSEAIRLDSTHARLIRNATQELLEKAADVAEIHELILNNEIKILSKKVEQQRLELLSKDDTWADTTWGA